MKFFKKLRVMIFLFLVAVFVLDVSSTYAKYVSEASGTASASFAKWQVLVNNNDITSETTNTVTITPTIEQSANVATGKLAPGSTGYFDLLIDAQNAETSFNYTVSVSVPSTNDVSDIKITHYAITTQADIAANRITKIAYNGSSSITNTKYYDNNTANFKFAPFIVRIYFIWDDATGSMNDAQDSHIGTQAAQGATLNGQINATLAISQYTGA